MSKLKLDPSIAVSDEIFEERIRQIDIEGWTLEHDDEHTDRQLAITACRYADPYSDIDCNGWPEIPDDWPWSDEWWKPKSYRQNLVRAGALIIAEIERLDRQEDSDE